MNAGSVVWLTGLPAAGKSTLAHAAAALLRARGHSPFVLDGDDLRRGLCRDLGFSPHERTENLRRAGEVAALLASAGHVVLAAFVSPERAQRELVRGIVGGARFVEVWVATPLAVCERRDPKGLYRKARAGELTDLTGVGAPYEPPPAPDLVVGDLPDEAGVPGVPGVPGVRSVDTGAEAIVSLLLRRDLLVEPPEGS